jgi:hypothetical protein
MSLLAGLFLFLMILAILAAGGVIKFQDESLPNFRSEISENRDT